jgi:very-short-patch-repair endonuclease
MANEQARALRKRLTPQEVKLWVHLRSWKSLGFHFRRQVPRDGYILDFACIRGALIVEVDGGQHNDDANLVKDWKRDEHFRKQGFEVLRFWNSDVIENLNGVLERIFGVLQSRTTPPRPFGGGIDQAFFVAASPYLDAVG